MKLREYLEIANSNSITLYHSEEDVNEYTLVDFNIRSFTPEGLIYWADVLDSELDRLENNKYGTTVWVSEVPAQRVEELQAAHAGYCAPIDWDIWFQYGDE